MMFTKVVTFCLFSLQYAVSVFGSEPVCSRFHYEEQTLEKMIRQEIAVEKMKSEMEDMARKVEATLNDIGVKKDEIGLDLEKKNVAFEQMERKMEDTVTDIEARIGEKMKAYSEEMETVKASVVTPSIAFKAQKVIDKALSTNKVIVFTENILNLGDAYNNKTGIFVAPVAGLYMFTAQICLSSADVAYFGIFIGAKRASATIIGDTTWQNCDSFDAILLVEAGEQLSVKCSGSCTSEHLYENGEYATSSFSGVLLHSITV